MEPDELLETCYLMLEFLVLTFLFFFLFIYLFNFFFSELFMITLYVVTCIYTHIPLEITSAILDRNLCSIATTKVSADLQ
jgi:hypothetical protein